MSGHVRRALLFVAAPLATGEAGAAAGVGGRVSGGGVSSLVVGTEVCMSSGVPFDPSSTSVGAYSRGRGRRSISSISARLTFEVLVTGACGSSGAIPLVGRPSLVSGTVFAPGETPPPSAGSPRLLSRRPQTRQKRASGNVVALQPGQSFVILLSRRPRPKSFSALWRGARAVRCHARRPSRQSDHAA